MAELGNFSLHILITPDVFLYLFIVLMFSTSYLFHISIYYYILEKKNYMHLSTACS